MIACARCEMWYHADICIEVPKNACVGMSGHAHALSAEMSVNIA